MMEQLKLPPERITAWLGTWDYPVQVACAIAAFLQEFPASLDLRHQDSDGGYDLRLARDGQLAPGRLRELFGLQDFVPIIGMPHHDNHASFSYLASPFARDTEPVMVLVSDGSGDCASISLYLGIGGKMQLIRHNGSLHDSLGIFYSIVSATQGGWTHLSSEGRYMGAAAYGNMNRGNNRYYSQLSKIFRLEPDGFIHLNRSLANWHRSPFHKPYSAELIESLGPPIAVKDMWNPNAVLRVEDIRHQPPTQERVERAAAIQLVFEDGLFHIVDSFIRSTGSNRLVLSGGTALNALANMHLLERFDEDYYSRVFGSRKRLHLWVPPVAGDAGVTLGAAYSFILSAGVPPGPALRHAFYCGRGFTSLELTSALGKALDLEWMIVGNTVPRSGIEAIADLMASITARDGVLGIVQGPAEIGPRALDHRSIVANAANPRARELINERVKYRESTRPLRTNGDVTRSPATLRA
jgi:carbamoyltransferase